MNADEEEGCAPKGAQEFLSAFICGYKLSCGGAAGARGAPLRDCGEVMYLLLD